MSERDMSGIWFTGDALAHVLWSFTIVIKQYDNLSTPFLVTLHYFSRKKKNLIKMICHNMFFFSL